MPDEDLERCDRHPGSPAVARCDGCGRAMCLACTTPVRGQTYGAECIGLVLGPEAAAAAEPPSRTLDATPRAVARLAFGLATLATVLPWSRFGPGSAAFGAWSRSARWSVVAAVATLIGLGLSLAQRSARLRTPGWDIWVAISGAAVALSSALSVAYPTAFSRPWLGPWIGVASGTLACGATILASRAEVSSTARI